MSALHDRVKETTTGTGAGNLTLAGAVSQFVALSARYAVGEYFDYHVVGQSGTEWESGVGHLLDATTLVRDEVKESSNADTFVVFSAGTKDVFISPAGADISSLSSIGLNIALGYNGAFI